MVLNGCWNFEEVWKIARKPNMLSWPSLKVFDYCGVELKKNVTII